MKNCPYCGRPVEPGGVSWPILDERTGSIINDGCQECWEKQCSDGWWDFLAGYFAVIPTAAPEQVTEESAP